MADITRTIADSSGFIPQYWAQRALDVLRNQIVATQFVARDTNFAEPGWKGKSITVPYPGTLVAQDKVANTPITPQTPTGGASVTLTLDHQKVVGILIEDFGAAVANGSLMDRYIQPSVVALAEQVENDVLSQFTGFTGTTVGTSGTDATGATVRQARKALNIAKAPMNDRTLVVSPKDEVSLLGDTTLQSFFAFSQPSTVKNGVIGKIYGLDVAMSQLTPTNPEVTILASGTVSGNYTLTFNGQTTGNIAYNASAATVQAALIALSSVGTGNCIVTGTTPTTAGGVLQVYFTGALYGTTLPLTGSASGLTNATLPITTTTSCLAMQKDAIMLAFRPFEPAVQGAGVMTAQVTDPESGLVLRLSVQYDINNSGYRMNLDCLYGLAVLRPTLGSIVQS